MALTFFAYGIQCDSCANAIKGVAQTEDWISEVTINILDKSIIIIPKNNIKNNIKSFQKNCEDIGFPLSKKPNYWPKILSTGLTGFALFILCASGFVMPLLAMYIIGGISSLIIFYAGFDAYKKCFKEVYNLQFTMNTLITVSTLSLLIISLLGLALPLLGLTTYFDSILMIFFFFYLGKIIKDYAREKIHLPSFKNIVSKKTRKINNYKNNNQEEININTNLLEINTIILIKKGGIIPVNCEILDMENTIEIHDGMASGRDLKYQDLIELKNNKKLLLAGTKVTQGELYLKVIATEQESALVLLDNKIREAAGQEKTNFQISIINKIIHYMVPGIFSLAIIAGMCIGYYFTPLLGLQIGLSILVAICPCMLGIILPLAIRAAQNKAIEHDFIIQESKALEMAANKKIQFFIDLNGTVTNGKPIVDEKSSFFKEHDALNIFYLLEKNSKHRIGMAICEFIEKNYPSPVDFSFPPCGGRRPEGPEGGYINGKYYTAGDSSRVLTYGIKQEQLEQYSKEKNIENTEGHIIFLVSGENQEDQNKEIIGHIVLYQDHVRPDTKEFFDGLNKKNINYTILTGSDEKNAHYFTRQLNIPDNNVKTSCVNKKQIITEFKKNNPDTSVIIVGNDPNDIAAMSANGCVSIAVDSADPLVSSGSQVQLRSPSLMPILKFLDLSKQFTRHLKQNLILNFACNGIAVSVPLILLFTLGFALNPAWAAGFVILQSILVLACAGWFYYQPLKSPSPQPSLLPCALGPEGAPADYLKAEHLASEDPYYRMLLPQTVGDNYHKRTASQYGV